MSSVDIFKNRMRCEVRVSSRRTSNIYSEEILIELDVLQVFSISGSSLNNMNYAGVTMLIAETEKYYKGPYRRW